MEKLRKPFQGVLNIIRFNWHFYAMAIIAIGLFLCLSKDVNPTVKILFNIISILIFATTFISLIVSFYVYDLSNLYSFDWLENDENDENEINILNINAGFDETSALLNQKFKNANFSAFDFYDPKKHTEISIKRARKAYPLYPNTKSINPSRIELSEQSVDKVFVILAAHEIRNNEERVVFFKELNRILKPKGRIIITEHLRDFANFTAYNVGAFHFYSKQSWLNTFNKSQLKVVSEIKNTPFISTYILEKNGNTL